MNMNDPRNHNAAALNALSASTPRADRDPSALYTEDELRSLAEDVVRYCPSLTHLLLALGSKNSTNPLKGLN